MNESPRAQSQSGGDSPKQVPLDATREGVPARVNIYGDFGLPDTPEVEGFVEFRQRLRK